MQEKAEQEVQITQVLLERYHEDLNALYESNLNLRMKYPTDPMRFYQTQEDIDNILQNLQEITQQHIPIVVASNILSSILKLLNHPNEDINISCIEFLHELISEQPQKDNVFEVYYRMCVWLVDNGLYDSLVETLNKMNEEDSVEQYEVSLKILKIIEALTEQIDSSVEVLVSDTKILQYLANRIMPNYVVNHKVIDDNKYVGSDVLAFILSNSEAAQVKFHSLCGMEILVESIRPYLSRSPTSSDEKEYLSNLFNCLNLLLINSNEELLKSRIIYHEMKGNQIMLQFVKSKTENAVQALKAIANSFTSLDKESANRVAEQLIDFGGLKYIFPILLRQGIKGQDIDEQMVIDQNCLRIVLAMIVDTSQIYKMRVEAKLSEKRFAKLEKLFEVRTEYMQNIGKDALKEVGPEAYLQKMKDGLGVIEIIDTILCHIIFSTSTVKQKLLVLLKLYGVLPQDIEFTLKTRYNFMGQGPEKRDLERLLSESLPVLSQEASKQTKPADQLQ